MASYTAASTISALNGTIQANSPSSGGYAIQISGLTANNNVVIAEVSLDNTTWFSVPLQPVATAQMPPLSQASMSSDGLYVIPLVASGFYFRLRCTTYNSGTITAEINGVDNSGIPAELNVGILSGESVGIEPANYTLVSANGSTTVKNSAGTLYAIINTAATSLLSSFVLKDGTTTIIPSNALLNSAANGVQFGPAGMKFNTNLVVTLGGLLTNPVLVIWA